MEKPEISLSEDFNLVPEVEFKNFRKVVKSLMKDASKVLVDIELPLHGAEIEEKLSILGHYLDYTRRLCEK